MTHSEPLSFDGAPSIFREHRPYILAQNDRIPAPSAKKAAVGPYQDISARAIDALAGAKIIKLITKAYAEAGVGPTTQVTEGFAKIRLASARIDSALTVRMRSA